MRLGLALLVSALSVDTLSPALAEAKLVQSSPAAGATVAAPRSIKLTFSENITAGSSAELSIGDGMGIPTKSSVSDDGKTLTTRPTAPFMAGKWTLSWHATATDGQQSQGSYNFTVK
jgi:methionine-rich copper-binding protein CopC